MSDDGRFRYLLRRTWGPMGTPNDRAEMGFIMLNPSTADATLDDPTIRRCVGYAKREGFGGLVVANLFAYRATSPKDLAAAGFPTGDPENQRAIGHVIETCPVVVAAWGAMSAPAVTRARRSALAIAGTKGRRLWCLSTTASGAPGHPLYLPLDAPLVEWPVRGGAS